MRKVRLALLFVLVLQACEEDEASLFTDASTSPSQAADGGRSDVGARVDAGGMVADAARPLDSSAPTNLNRAQYANVGRDAALDYALKEMWACRPGNEPDECLADLTATEILKDGSKRVVEHKPAENPQYDCFYVYPTVATQGGGNMTDFSATGIALVQDPLHSQAARFTRLCRVYAPLYRQVTLETDGGATFISPNADQLLGYSDVERAFRHYMQNFNSGRKYVLIGHSQGTSMLTALLSRVIDGDESLRKNMISAVILGGGPHAPPGAELGGSFKNIPKCTRPAQVGCVLAYVSYAVESPPSAAPMARFGRDVNTDAGVRQIVCTEPASLANNAGNYRGSYFRLRSNNPSFMPTTPPPADITTPFLLYRDYFKGKCVRQEPFSYLAISINKSQDDTREPPAYRNPRLESTGWGLHLVDFNLQLEDLLKAVELQAAAALR